MNKRKFLKSSVAAAFGVAGSPLMFANTKAACSSQSEYRAIVQVYLQGGNDLNMLIPNDDDQFNRYQRFRGDFALRRSSLKPITSTVGGVTEQYGLHESMGPLKSVYESGDLAFVLNIGALRNPITKAQFLNRSRPIPPRLFAHNSQTEFIISGLPRNGERLTGWGGRLADLCAVSAGSVPIGLNVSSSKQLWLRGASSEQMVFGLGTSLNGNFFRFDRPAFQVLEKRSQAVRALQRYQNYENAFTQEVARKYGQSVDNLEQLGSIGTSATAGTLDNKDLEGQLRSVLRLIESREQLGHNQQLFFVEVPGWDFHSDALNRHSALLNKLAMALSKFNTALRSLGISDNVTTMTTSDFGRTLTGNGSSGTDHAWGGTQLVMGGNVNGGRVYGSYPKFEINDENVLDSRGILIPTLGTDQLSAAVAKWFAGLNDSQLQTMFPNLVNFSQKTIDIYT